MKRRTSGSIEVRDNDIWNGVLCYFAICCYNFMQLEISLYSPWIALIREIGNWEFTWRCISCVKIPLHYKLGLAINLFIFLDVPNDRSISPWKWYQIYSVFEIWNRFIDVGIIYCSIVSHMKLFCPVCKVH